MDPAAQLAALERWEQASAVLKALEDDPATNEYGVAEGTPGRARYELNQAKQHAAWQVVTAAALEVVDAHGARDRLLAIVRNEIDDTEALSALAERTSLPYDLVEQAQRPLAWDEQDPEFGPALTVADADALPPETPSLIPYFAWAGLKTVLAAREKWGKSTLIMAGTSAASRGDAFLGAQLTQQTILYLSEEPSQVPLRRIKEMRATASHFKLVHMRADPPAQLAHYVATLRPSIIVIDTLWWFAKAYVHDENSAAQWTPVLSALERYADEGIAVVLLAHTSKRGEYRGSTAIGGFADVLLEMRAPKNGDTVRTFDAKSRIFETTEFSVDRIAPPGGFVLVGAETTDRATDAANDTKVLAWIRNRPRTTGRKIEKGIRKGYKTVQRALARLHMAGAIEVIPSDPVTYIAKEAA